MLILSTVSLLLLAVIVIIVLIQNHKNVFIIMTVITILIFGIGFSWLSWDLIRGTPINQIPEKESLVIHTLVEKPMVFIWVKDEDGHRLYTFPWTKERAKKLEGAQEDMKKGHRVLIKPEKSGNETTKNDFVMYRWQHQEQMPKK